MAGLDRAGLDQTERAKGRTVAVIQSSYIPWKGYFDIIHDADVFVFYDDVQFTKQDWRSRNRIKGSQGPQWLSIPVGGRLDRRICDVTISSHHWAEKHWKTLVQCYAATPHFEALRPFLIEMYLERKWHNLSEFNQFVTSYIAREFHGTHTEFRDSRQWSLRGADSERLLDLLVQLETSTYVTGPAARLYLDEAEFAEAGIRVVYKDYDGYPQYPQRFPPFDHYLTILDLLCNVGVKDSPWYIWGWRSKASTP